MLRKFAVAESPKWDTVLPYLLYSIGEVPQYSMGFSSFELLYGRRTQGILDLLQGTWHIQGLKAQNVVQYILQLR